MADPISLVMDRAVQRWQTHLLQLDRRNRLLYMKTDRTSIPIDVGAGGVDGFVSELANAKAGLAFTWAGRRPNGEVYEIPGHIRTAVPGLDLQRRLKALRGRDREFTAEQGVNVLFLAAGILEWIDEDGQQARSPLVLLPADLNVASQRDPFYLTLEGDEPAVNGTLKHVLSTQGIELPEYSGDGPIMDYLEKVRAAVKHHDDWTVCPDAVLSTFQYSKMAMWEDLQQMREEGIGHELVRRLAGDTEVGPTKTVATDDWPSSLAGGRLDDLVDIKKQFLVLPADASQLQAIEAARRGGHLVIHGPPGTGKSQTIANLISTFIADGRKVLFVSEKTAALDVVKRRLDEADLGIFCLDLHSERGRKANVYAQLKESLEARQTSEAPLLPYAELVQQRDRLNQLTRSLHSLREPLGTSVFRAIGRYAVLRNFPDVPFAVHSASELTQDQIAAMVTQAKIVSDFETEFREHDFSPLRSLRRDLETLGLENRIAEATTQLKSAIAVCRTAAAEVCSVLGLPIPACAAELGTTAQLLEHLTSTPSIPASWLEPGVVAELQAVAKSQSNSQQRHRERTAAVEGAFGGSRFGNFSFVSLRTDATACQPDPEAATAVLGINWPTRMIAEAATLQDATDRLPAAIAAVSAAFDSLRERVGLTLQPTRSDAARLIAACRFLERALPLPESWLEEGAITGGLDEQIRAAKEATAGLAVAEEALLADFDDRVVAVVDEEMLGRFRTDHRKFIKRLGGAYKADIRALQANSLRTEKLNVESGLRAVQCALALRDARAKWSATEERMRNAFERRFRGRDTDWADVEQELVELRTLVARGMSLERLRAASATAAQGELPELRVRLEQTLQALAAVELAILGSPASPTARFDSLQVLLEGVADPIRCSARLVEALQPHCRRFPEKLPELRKAVLDAAKWEERRAQAESEFDSLKVRFGSAFSGWKTDWKEVSRRLGWTQQLLSHLPDGCPNGVVEAATGSTAVDIVEGMERLQSAGQQFAAAISSLDRFLERPSCWSSWDSASFDELEGWLDELSARSGREARWLAYRGAYESLERLANTSVVTDARAKTSVSSDLPGLVERRLLGAWLGLIFRAEPELEEFTAAGQEGRVRSFRELDCSLLQGARKLVRSIAFANYPNRFLSHSGAGELGIVEGQVNRKRGHMPVRRLLARAPSIVQALKPCFMMSPLAVSQHLERGADRAKFDVVIFDEASQVFPEDAVPAIDRAAQVIVVGDQKQLPPTSFFRKTDDDSDDYDSQDKDTDEEDDDGLAGRESILDALLGTGFGVRQQFLEVHYRSRHEDLIRFSNHLFYGNRLLVFPSPKRAGDLGIRSHYVPAGRYDSGGTRTNAQEAKEVVDLVFRLMRSVPAHESIGVVALSRAQAMTIEAAVQDRRLLERDLDFRFSDELHEPFFVKNLENVQGDERDHMILSIGYGPTTGSGAVPQRFGPINNDGGGDPSYGQRRLNVAVSRARMSFTVVHSLQPAEITAQSRGARTLRRFLEYAANPSASFEAEQSFDPDAVADSDFEQAVAEAIRLRGYEVQHQVGVAGYRIDLAVWSSDRSRFILGVECDGWTYHHSPAARDRDWLRQQVLEGLGWRVHRVWSTAFARDPLGETDRIVAAIEQSRAFTRAEPPADTNVAEREGGPHTIPDDESEPNDADSDAIDEEAEDAEVAARAQHLFDPYVVAQLRPRRGELRYETYNSLQPQLRLVIELEGPVHFEVILARLREAYGVSRAGDPSREAVASALDKMARNGEAKAFGKGSDAYYELPNLPVRARYAQSRQERRDPEHIHGTELRAGLVRVSSVFGADERQRLIRETWYQFGYERVGADMQSRMEQALEWLIQHGDLVVTDEGLIRINS